MYNTKLVSIALLFSITSFFSSCGQKKEAVVDQEQTEETQTEHAEAKEETPEIAKPAPTPVKKPQASKPKQETVAKEEPKPEPVAKEEPKPEPAKPVIMTVDAGKKFNISLSEALDTKSLQVDQSFKGTLTSAIVVNGKDVLPANTQVVGKVVAVQNEKKMGGKSKLDVTLTQVFLNGVSYNVKTNTLPFEGKNKIGNTAAKTGAGAAVGAGIGALAGKKGDKGKAAGIGAAVGAAVGVGAAALGKKGSLILEEGTEMTFDLEQSVNVELPPVK